MGSETLLAGRSILIVEDEPLITFELVSLFESVGAHVVAVPTREKAAQAIASSRICAALLDHGLGEDSVTPLCALLAQRHVPFMFYTGDPDLRDSYPHATIVQKPATGEVLLSTMADIVVGPPLDGISLPGNGSHHQFRGLRQFGQP